MKVNTKCGQFKLQILMNLYVINQMIRTDLANEFTDTKKKKNKLSRSGYLWDIEEDQCLRFLVEKKISWSLLSKLHGRSKAALKHRFHKIKNKKQDDNNIILLSRLKDFE
ncbi:unnamed protein product [Cunninghamella blakesleeana]